MPKISELSAASALAATSLLVVVTDGSPDTTEKVTGQQLIDFVHSRTVAVPVMAPAIRPRSSNGCASLAAVSAGSGKPDMLTLDFDAASTEYAQFALAMPSSWNESTITAKFYWSHAATTTNFGVVWGIQAVAMSDDDTQNASYGTVQTVNDTGGTTDDLYVTAATSAMTVAGSPQAGDLVSFQIYRDQAAGADTMAVDARLHAVVLFITTNAATDS